MGKRNVGQVISNDQTRPVRGAQRKKPVSVEQELTNVPAKAEQRHATETMKQRAVRTEPEPITASEDCAAVCRSTLEALERFAKDVEALTVDDGGARIISTFPAAARLNASYQNAVHAYRLLGERLFEVYGQRERFKKGPVIETATMKYGKGGAPLILGSATQALAAALAWPSTLPGLEEKDGREVFAPRFKFGYRIEACEWESLKTGIKAVRLHVEEAHAPADQEVPTSSMVTHATDFTWLKAGSKRYNFGKGNQARTIEALFKEWRKGGDGAGLNEETIKELIGSRDEKFRVGLAFRGHQALKTILRSIGKGQFALFLSKTAE